MCDAQLPLEEKETKENMSEDELIPGCITALNVQERAIDYKKNSIVAISPTDRDDTYSSVGLWLKQMISPTDFVYARKKSGTDAWTTVGIALHEGRA